MFCNNCHRNLQHISTIFDDIAYCPFCGKVLPQKPSEDQQEAFNALISSRFKEYIPNDTPDKIYGDNKQLESLKSLLFVLEKLKRDYGDQIFKDENKFYEACAKLEGPDYHNGIDLLLTLFLKDMPQWYATAANNNDFDLMNDLKDIYEDRLYKELGINRSMAFAIHVIIFLGIAAESYSQLIQSQPSDKLEKDYAYSQQSKSNTTKPHITQLNKPLESLRTVVKKIRTENYNSIDIFLDSSKLYEICSSFNDEIYLAGRDLLLTIIMKKIPQELADIYLSENEVFWSMDIEERLTKELEMRIDFARDVLKIIKEEFESATKKSSRQVIITDDSWKTFVSKHPKNSEVNGEIVRMLNYAIIVKLADDIEGFIPISNLTAENIKTPAEAFKVGEKIPAVVTEINQNNHKMILSVLDYFKYHDPTELTVWMEKHKPSRI